MALSFQNLFCSGSEDFDDEDFLSVLEGTESSHGNHETTSVCLRPIPTEDTGAGKSLQPLPVQKAANAERSSPETRSVPSSVQDVDDEELLSLCSQLEAEVSSDQCRAPGPHLLLRTVNQTVKTPSSSSLQLRPSRRSHDAGPSHCLSGITGQSQHPHFSANHPTNHSSHLSGGGQGLCQSPGPTAKRPCLRPGVEPQPVTPVRSGTFTNPSNFVSPRSIMSPSASGSANVWQTGPANSHPVPRTPLSSPRPHPPSTLQTPVVTNHLLQLMTAANKTPKNLPWETPPPKERKFPGPAGLLPQQGSGRRLDEILVSTPHTPSHGARAKVNSKEGVSAQQPAEDQFIKGPWATMKAELSLDENDPTCFLRTYSVVMVLRKAALKQLPKNKVPRMAVALKTLTPANGDASAVFRDPTGDIQGTVHHLLLEERESELKIGSVLLLQQVGVFSPSHRNHYLNVTPSNLVKIYAPHEDGVKTGVPMPHDEVDLNSNQTRAPLVPSSGTNQPSAAQTSPTPLSSTSQARASQAPVTHLPGSHTPSNTTRLRSAQPPSFRLSFSAEKSESPQPDWDLDDLDSMLCDLPED
ncbi:homologous recombination OB-fold protein isoform X1 [Bufo bufo]|uniref:homologous recombination OB-fold protein isoform X1 n=1 Tax=Bufo bufo TaxID=8384 RepID=UPI001ABE268D|nr:homologous recombination OB-fold protein isoform X1 [Bufo bufo]